MEKTKILIIVEGGIVQSVHADDDIQIVVIDYDKQADERCIVSEILSPDTIILKRQTFHEQLFTKEDAATSALKELNY